MSGIGYGGRLEDQSKMKLGESQPFMLASRTHRGTGENLPQFLIKGIQSELGASHPAC
jgi:hypothetical protein